MACFQQLLEKPGGILGDGEARRAIAQDRFADDVLQNIFALASIFQKGLWGHRVNQAMSKAVGSNFMPAVKGLFNQLREPLSNVTKKETSYVHIVFAEQVEEPAKIALNTRWQRIPFGNIWRRCDLENVIPILHVYGKNIFHCKLPFSAAIDKVC